MRAILVRRFGEPGVLELGDSPDPRPGPGQEAEFHAFEDVALPLMAEYGGELLLRIRPTPESVIASRGEAPYEIHVIRFASDEDLRRFSADPQRKAVLHLKDGSVRTTLLVKGEPV